MGAIALLYALPILAHHSYAMFDLSKLVTVKGTVAKLDWSNPHVRLWVYVPSSAQASGFELYAFQSGGINILVRSGWNKNTFAPGDKVSIDYYPLRDGRAGGDFIRARRADGRLINGDPAAAQLPTLAERAKP